MGLGTDDEQSRGPRRAVEFEELLREVQERMHGVLDEQARLQLLLDAVVTMAADLSLDSVLSKITSIASSLVSAEYAALGVLGSGRDRRLRMFVHHGMSPTLATEIGELPRGHGLLGLIIDRPEPLRLHDIAEHPESFGFPPNHPPMHSFLGVPVRIRGQVFGNLYLTEKAGGADFSADDEAIVVALAAAAGVVIENARLYEEATRRESWLNATAEVVSLLSAQFAEADGLHAVVQRAREVARADAAWIVAGPSPEELSVRAVAGVDVPASGLAGMVLDTALARLVVEKGEPLSLEDLNAEPGRVDPGDLPGDWPVLGPTIVVPIDLGPAIPGALALAWAPENIGAYHDLDVELPASFAKHAGLALQVALAHRDQQRLAVFEDRDRIGRDLHDLVIQRLFAVGLMVQGAARLSDMPALTERLDQAVDDVDATIKEIRRTIFALGSIDAAADIQTEISTVVSRAAATLKFRPTLKLEGPVRTLVDGDLAGDVLAVLAEALSNAGRHANATAVDIILRAGSEIVLAVADNGRGLSAEVRESGLANIRQRAEARGGSLTIESEPGAGTSLRWSVPRV
ncbi:sensor histidine kinase [Nocardioides pelophilus]|uniref:sensor histidine kinase n=1 Tax=Nocardioides pelophilus TaxID=2172019 RepID=UPI0015FFECF9|nr:GAF domain-containing protein [Nocardioides pelophilus]